MTQFKNPYLIAFFLLVTLGNISANGAAMTIDQCEFIRVGVKKISLSGGEFVIPAGTYKCNSAIVLDQDNVTLRGAGNVQLILAEQSNSPVIVMGDLNTPPQPRRNIKVTHLKIDGNRQQQSFECWGGPCDGQGLSFIRNNGITVRGLTDGVISDVTTENARSGGVVTEKGCYNLQIEHLIASQNQFDGFAGYETYGSVIAHSTLKNNLAAGISMDIHFDGNTFRDVLIQDNADVGIFMRASSSNIFAELRIIGNLSHGIFLAQVEDVSTCPIDNQFENLTVVRSRGFGFLLNNACTGNRLTGHAEFLQNQSGCIHEGTSVPLMRDADVTCLNR